MGQARANLKGIWWLAKWQVVEGFICKSSITVLGSLGLQAATDKKEG